MPSDSGFNSYDYNLAVQKAVMAAYGKKIDPEVVELFIRNGDTSVSDNYKNIFREEADKYCHKIFDALYVYKINPAAYKRCSRKMINHCEYEVHYFVTKDIRNTDSCLCHHVRQLLQAVCVSSWAVLA